jgi:hypothetical protein
VSLRQIAGGDVVHPRVEIGLAGRLAVATRAIEVDVLVDVQPVNQKFWRVDLPLATPPTVNRKLPVRPSIAEPSTTLSNFVMSMRLGPGSTMVPDVRVDAHLAWRAQISVLRFCSHISTNCPADHEQREQRYDAVQHEARPGAMTIAVG